MILFYCIALYLARLAAAKSKHGGLLCSVTVSSLFFNDSCQTNYLKVFRTDLRQIFSVGTTMVAYDQCEIVFFDPSSDVAMANDFVVVHECRRLTQAASGAAGRANVGLCPAPSVK